MVGNVPQIWLSAGQLAKRLLMLRMFPFPIISPDAR